MLIDSKSTFSNLVSSVTFPDYNRAESITLVDNKYTFSSNGYLLIYVKYESGIFHAEFKINNLLIGMLEAMQSDDRQPFLIPVTSGDILTYVKAGNWDDRNLIVGYKFIPLKIVQVSNNLEGGGSNS